MQGFSVRFRWRSNSQNDVVCLLGIKVFWETFEKSVSYIRLFVIDWNFTVAQNSNLAIFFFYSFDISKWDKNNWPSHQW